MHYFIGLATATITIIQKGCVLASIKRRHRFCSRHEKPLSAKVSPKATKIIKTALLKRLMSYLQT